VREVREMREMREMRWDEAKKGEVQERDELAHQRENFFAFSAPSACCTSNACGRSSLPNRARLVAASKPITGLYLDPLSRVSARSGTGKAALGAR
jgi:hypothetical protein